MENFIHQYGVLAILLWALVENDMVFIMTGVTINLGVVHPGAALGAAILGSLLHDCFWFALGRHRSDWIRSSSVYQRVGPFIERLAARFGPWELFVCRFVYGTRNPSVIFWGVQRLATSKFLFINALGITLWCAILSALGYFLSDRAIAVIGHVKRIENWLLGALGVALIILAIERLFGKRQIKKLSLPKDDTRSKDDTLPPSS